MCSSDEVHQLALTIRNGSVRALSRGLSWVETGGERAEALCDLLYPYTQKAYVIGITGAPGAGKSTLVTSLVEELRRRKAEVGVLAVDPSSPYTGGAILGDRIRMNELSSDKGVFIRSMATRGALGGLARAAADAIDLFCASGKQFVVVETVGVGQDEVDIARIAHTTVVVSVPGLGDEIQALKAGIIEIADIHVVNKADREGAERTISELRNLLAMAVASEHGWDPPIVSCIAPKGVGIPELVNKIEEHRSFLSDTRQINNRLRTIAEDRVLHLVKAIAARSVGDSRYSSQGVWEQEIQRVVRREISPYRCAEAILAKALTSEFERKTVLSEVN